jgi:L-lactate transport
MWPQNYTPVANNLALSALVAALPIFTLLYLMGVKKKPAWIASLAGLATAAIVAVAAYRMPVRTMLSSVGYGAAFGIFPIGWVVFAAILLFRVTVDAGKFQIVRDSIGSLTPDRRLQAMLIAFAFGAFIEGAAGFSTPVAVAGAMLAGLGFPPFYATALCLLANTAPVAFGSIAIPVITLAGVTGLPLDKLSATVGRICAPVSVFIPAYLVAVMGGWRALRGVLPAAAVCGITFAGVQFAASNFISPQLTDILSSLAALAMLILLFRVWKPRDSFALEGFSAPSGDSPRHSVRALLEAWSAYALLVVAVLLWGSVRVKTIFERFTISFPWPGLHNAVMRMPPITGKASGYPAIYNLNWLSASGTACFVAAVLAAFLVLRIPPRQFARSFVETNKKMVFPEITIAAVLALAFLMNYSGATATLGLAFASTGKFFPPFSALLGWLGVFLSGSDTSANALFGNLQVITAGRLGLNPILMAAANSSGGVMGKMISLQSIAVAAAATAMPSSDESKLFRFTLKHSVILVSAIALITTLYAYVLQSWVP